MKDTSRRVFLAVGGAGAATIGAAAVAPAAVAAGAFQGRRQPDGSMVAYVSDVGTGRLSVMAGEREVVIHDRALVARLARAVASGR